MKKTIAAAAMAALVVIAGITGASSAAHAAVFFAPAGRLKRKTTGDSAHRPDSW